MKTLDHHRRARMLMPGGTQLFSKRPELYAPGRWPACFERCAGITVTDLDGRSYRDMSLMGVGACVLGYGDPEVDEAVIRAIRSGVQCSLNVPEEVFLAEKLLEMHPWAGKARFARGGGEAAAMAVRIARAHTGRDMVAVCGYHGWHDWYLAANLHTDTALDGHLLPGLSPAGVPRALSGTTHTFRYNRLDEFTALLDERGKDLAAVIMEPQRSVPPEDGFLETVRDLTREAGAVLIFDEITTGFRVTTGGLHLRLGLEPDMAVFAKALANGYAMAAVIGTDEVMSSAGRTFMSSTAWSERIGPAAALATIEKMEREPVHEHVAEMGRMMQRGWREIAARTAWPVTVGGHPALSHFVIDHPRARELSAAFTGAMLERGFLACTQFKPSFAHGEEDITDCLSAAEEVLASLARHLHDDTLPPQSPVAPGFCRLV